MPNEFVFVAIDGLDEIEKVKQIVINYNILKSRVKQWYKDLEQDGCNSKKKVREEMNKILGVLK